MLPQLGKGKFVSVYRKGSYIDIVDEKTQNIMRLIPCQRNHGIMIEEIVNGKLCARMHMDYNYFKNYSCLKKESN